MQSEIEVDKGDFYILNILNSILKIYYILKIY